MALKEVFIRMNEHDLLVEEVERPTIDLQAYELPVNAPLNLSAVWGIDEKTHRMVMRWETGRAAETQA